MNNDLENSLRHKKNNQLERTMLKNIEQQSVLSYIIILFVPIIGLALGVGLSVATSLNGQPEGNLITNAVFVGAVLSLVP